MTRKNEASNHRYRLKLSKSIGLVAGLLVFVLILFLPTGESLSPPAKRLAAVTGLMAIFWLSQTIPIAATSLIPIAAFPLLGIQTAEDVSHSYMNKSILLFLGGFIIALGIEKWGLHKRIALYIIRVLGMSLPRLILGFMLATAFLSMWISNTASTLLMLPIGLAMLSSLESIIHQNGTGKNKTDQSEKSQSDLKKVATILMLAIAYSASLGGMATLVGTPTNIQFQQIWSDQFPDMDEISAGEWTFTVAPVVFIYFMATWCYLICFLPSVPELKHFRRSYIKDKIHALGKTTRAEYLMLLVFSITALLWILRTPVKWGDEIYFTGWGIWGEKYLLYLGATKIFAAKAIHDSTVAIAMVILMFMIPAAKKENGDTDYLMDWETTQKIPWGILLLIGGGFAIANAFKATGLSLWFGSLLATYAANWPLWLLIAVICFMMTFLTELTSNVATVSAVLPILASTATEMNLDPRMIMIPATLATSCAFMLPVATPPNAIVFSSGKIEIATMAKYGIVLNLFGVALLTIFTMLFL